MKLKTILLASMMTAFTAASQAATGRAQIKGTAPASKAAGTITLSDVDGGLKAVVKLSGLPPGKHAFHIHEFGSCDDAGKAAGDHYNPAGAKHGNVLKDGPGSAHAGDMGSIEVGADGKASVELIIPGLSLAGAPHGAAGRAFILHEKADDFSQPAGNAGGRIACGPIVITGK